MDANVETEVRKWPRRLRREQACEYLGEVHGVRRKPATLAAYAVRGGGPVFVRDGIFPLYSPESLDAWVESILSPPQTSTSDNGCAGAA